MGRRGVDPSDATPEIARWVDAASSAAAEPVRRDRRRRPARKLDERARGAVRGGGRRVSMAPVGPGGVEDDRLAKPEEVDGPPDQLAVGDVRHLGAVDALTERSA